MAIVEQFKLEDKQYVMDFFDQEYFYTKLRQFLEYIPSGAENTVFTRYTKFRIDMLKSKKEIYYLVTDNITDSLWLINDSQRGVESLWMDSLDMIKSVAEKKIGKDFDMYHYGNDILLVEREWWNSGANLLKFIKSFAYEESISIRLNDTTMTADLEKSKDGFIRVSVPVSYAIMLFSEKVRKVYKRANIFL